MTELPDSLVKGLVRHLPLIISRLDLGGLDNRAYNAVRLTRKALARMERAINDRQDGKTDSGEGDAGAA